MLRQPLDRHDMEAFEADAKVGLLATVDPAGLPHLTLITTLMAKDPTTLMWGQFSEGRSKQHVLDEPKTGFAVMTLDRQLWRGKAIWRGKRTDGPDYELMNRKPMFRYNSYFGIHAVHTMDLVEVTPRERLPLPRIIAATLWTRAVKPALKTRRSEPILKPWAQKLFNRLDTFAFVAWVGSDGFPRIVPLIQCAAADSRRLAFSPLAFGDELAAIPPGAPVAVFAMTTEAENVLVRGPFRGFRGFGPLEIGTIDIDWVYNSMPPVPGQIYPPQPLRAVREFQAGAGK